MERQTIALGSDFSEITCQGKGNFLVLSFTNNLSERYKVYFGNEHESQNVAAMTRIKQVICADIFLQVLKNFHHGHSMLKFRIIESTLINKGFFMRKKVAKDSGPKTVKNLSKYLATSLHYF